MIKTRKNRLASILFFSLLVSSCAVPGAPLRQPHLDWPGMRPIHARVVLLIPAEFERFTYVSVRQGNEIRHRLGEAGTDLLDALLRSAFSSSSAIPVRSESEAIAMIREGDRELQDADFIAVPRFSRADSWERGWEFGFDVDVMLDLYSPDGSRVENIRGHGESRTGYQSGSSAEQSARTALEYALDAVKDGLEMRRSSLSAGRRY